LAGKSVFINKFFRAQRFLVVAPFFLACLVILPTLEKMIRPILGSSFTRLDLLAYTWDFPQSVILAILATAFIATILGSYFLLKDVGKPRIFVGMFLLSLGLALPHVVVSPPFEAPDEPDHFRGFALHLADNSKHVPLEQSGARLSIQGQFTRIYTDFTAKFQPEDLLRTGSRDWLPHMFPTNMLERSSFTNSVWELMHSILEFKDANMVILCLRLVGCILFCIAIGASALVGAATMSSVETGVVVGCALLLVPALPFFAMHVSNYGLLTSMYAISAAGFFMSARLSREMSDLALRNLSFAFGAIAPLPILGAPAAFSFSVFPIFWGSIALCYQLAISFKKFQRCFLFMVSGVIATVVVAIPNLVALSTEWAHHAPGMMFSPEGRACSMLLIFVGIFACVARTGKLFPQKMRRTTHEPYAFVSNYSNYLVLVVILTVIIWPLIRHVEPQPNIEIPNALTKWMYVRSSVKKYFLNYTTLYSDLYLCSSFWNGFGWLEMPIQRSLVMLPKIVVPAAILVGAIQKIRLSRQGSFSSGIEATLLLATFAASAIAIAAMASALYPLANLHGRYLIGVEVALLVASMTYLTAEKFRAAPIRRTFLFLGVICLMKGITLNLLFERYF
jgi:hypothetical protein